MKTTWLRNRILDQGNKLDTQDTKSRNVAIYCLMNPWGKEQEGRGKQQSKLYGYDCTTLKTNKIRKRRRGKERV